MGFGDEHYSVRQCKAMRKVPVTGCKSSSLKLPRMHEEEEEGEATAAFTPRDKLLLRTKQRTSSKMVVEKLYGARSLAVGGRELASRKISDISEISVQVRS